MNNRELKRKVLAAAIEKHQSVINDFRARINAVWKEESSLNKEEYDFDRQSKVSEEVLTELNPLNEQLEFASEEMRLLNELKANQDVDHDVVALGSIVVTNRDTFFVSASIEQFAVDGKPFFGLSTKSPLYLSMKGKKKGDSFSYGEITYHILDII